TCARKSAVASTAFSQIFSAPAPLTAHLPGDPSPAPAIHSEHYSRSPLLHSPSARSPGRPQALHNSSFLLHTFSFFLAPASCQPRAVALSPFLPPFPPIFPHPENPPPASSENLPLPREIPLDVIP